MNPFIPIFLVLGATIVVNHLTGHLVPGALAIASLVLFVKEYIVYSDIRSSEPDRLRGVTNKIFFLFYRGSFRKWLIIAEILGLVAVVWTLVHTYGILST
jgi:hypothetical protein